MHILQVQAAQDAARAHLYLQQIEAQRQGVPSRASQRTPDTEQHRQLHAAINARIDAILQAQQLAATVPGVGNKTDVPRSGDTPGPRAGDLVQRR